MIPENIEQAANAYARNYPTGLYNETSAALAVVHGYSLAAAELEAKDRELQDTYDSLSHINAYLQKTEQAELGTPGAYRAVNLLEQYRQEIERLKGLLEKAWGNGRSYGYSEADAYENGGKVLWPDFASFKQTNNIP